MSKRPGIKKLQKLLYLLLIILVGSLAAGSPEVRETLQKSDPSFYKVLQILDGDTIVVEVNGKPETVRYIGVDTPETHDPRKPVQCFGQAAAQKHRELIGNSKVRFETDANESGRDKYRRLLRYVYLPDGTLINAKLIEEGYGFAYTIYPFTKLEEFRTLERQAREQGRGLWSGCKVKDGKVKQTTPE